MLVRHSAFESEYRKSRTAELEPAILPEPESEPILSNRNLAPEFEPGSGSKVKALCFLFKKHVFSGKTFFQTKTCCLMIKNMFLNFQSFLLRSWLRSLSQAPTPESKLLWRNMFFSELFRNFGKRLRSWSHSPEVGAGAWSGAFLIPGAGAKFCLAPQPCEKESMIILTYGKYCELWAIK